MKWLQLWDNNVKIWAKLSKITTAEPKKL